MKEVVSYIRSRKKHIQKNHPFIQWLGDESYPVEQRLGAWLPRLSALVMGFRDLNTYVFVYPEEEAELDKRKLWINNYVKRLYASGLPYEEDLARLGMDKTMSFEEVLLFLWNKNKDGDRNFFYRICALAYQNTDPILRYCQLLAIDDLIENVLFNKTREVVEDYVAAGGEDYFHYLGKLPPDLYSHEFIKETLTPEKRDKALAVAKEMMDQIEQRWHGFLQVSQEQTEIWV